VIIEPARFPLLWAGSVLVAVAGCSGPAIVESSATSVTLRYSAGGAEQAAELAQRMCAAHHKAARLRNMTNFGLGERYGHFDCI
jgi:hypothetical protein